MSVLKATSAEKLQKLLIAVLLAILILAAIFVTHEISSASSCSYENDFCVVAGEDITATYAATQKAELAVRVAKDKALKAKLTPIGGQKGDLVSSVSAEELMAEVSEADETASQGSSSAPRSVQ